MPNKTHIQAGFQAEGQFSIPPAIADQIKAEAAAAILDIARAVLPSDYQPHRPKNGSVDFARKHDGRTYTATTSGQYAGWVKDWRGRNMDAVALVQQYAGADSYADALHWLSDFLRIDTGLHRSEADRQELEAKAAANAQARAAEREAQDRLQAEQNARTKKQHREFAARWWGETEEIRPGSLADRYLVEWRSIPRPVEGWPSSVLRFHPKENALAVGLVDVRGKVQSAQRIYLDNRTGQKRTDIAKKMLPGSSKGLFFKLPARITVAIDVDRTINTFPIAATEGPETALSVWIASGIETWASIGAGADITPPTKRPILHCRDDDEEEGPAWNAAEKAAIRWGKEGHAVLAVWPYDQRRQDKSDLNDLLQTEGIGAVRLRLKEALDEYGRRIASLPKLPSADEARSILDQQIKLQVDGGYAVERSKLFTVGAGIGKTEAALRRVLQSHEAALTIHEDSEDATIPAPIVLSVPYHGLADEALERVRRISPNLTVRIWKGRAQQLPVPMCANLEEVDAIQEAGLSATERLCRGSCTKKDGCPYVKQMEQKADVWIITHACLFLPKPKAIRRPSFLILDEVTLDGAITGTSDAAHRSVNSILLPTTKQQNAPEDVRQKFMGFTLAEVENRASRIVAMLERAAEELERGTTCHLSRATIEQHFDLAGLENGLPEVEQAIQWMTPDDKGHPDFQIDRVKERTPILKALGRLAALMREMKRCLSEGLEATPRISFFWDEENVLRYRLTGCRSIHKHWIGPDENDQTPVILLDATPNLPLIRHFFPNLALGSDVQAATPHARFVWMQGKFWHGITQKNAIEQHRNGRKGKEHAQSIEGLRWTLWRHWLTSGCKPMLAVFSKALHDYLDEQEHKKSGFLPPGCELAHQGATRGRNSWETVRTVLIFGRMLPSVEPIEMTAEAMTGRPIQRIEKKKLGPDGTAEASHFHIIEKDRILPNGRIVSVKHYHHPDPVADGFLQAMVAGEAIQAAARGRAVNRTSDNPLEVFVYADTYAADMPLDDVQEATGPTAWDQMALSIAMETGQASDLSPILISSPTDAAKAYPRIWSTPKAAERGFDAGNHRPPNSYNNISIGIRGSVDWDAFSSLEGFTLARYQPEGARQKPRLAWVPIGQEIGFQSWIEQALCCDVRVEWVEVPQPDPTPPEPSKPIRSPAMDCILPDKQPAFPSWIIGGIERTDFPSSYLRFLERSGTKPTVYSSFFGQCEAAFGHGLGAEDENDDPALAWVMGLPAHPFSLRNLEEGMNGH